MANEWLRLWHDMPNDPKWRTIARISKQPITAVISVYLHLLVSSSTASDRGRPQSFNNEDVASALDLETDQIVAILTAMEGRVIENGVLTGWEKRQPSREDGSAERSKSNREKNKLLKELQQLKEKLSLMESDNNNENPTEVDDIRPHPTTSDRKRPTDTDKTNNIVVYNNITPSSECSELSTIDDLETEPPDEIWDNINFNDLIVCSDLVCGLLGQTKLSPADRSALQAWHRDYDMRLLIYAIRDEMVIRVRERKKTNSLRFFSYLTHKIPRRDTG